MDINGNGEMKMLKIIDFIKTHKDWYNILINPPYSLDIKEKGRLILFNYSQIESDPSNEIVKEARGTIIENGTFKPICVGFKRFYNLDELNAAKIDWSTATATSKEDGTLFFIYWYDNKWHIKTRSTFDAEEAPMSNIRFANFKELFDYLVSFYPNFSYEKLNKNYVYCLEGCSIFNQIVLKYDNPCLFHLMTRDMTTLQEIDTEIGIPKPQMYNLNNEVDYRKLVADFDESKEGIVIKDKFNNRVKLKTPLYFQLHKMRNNGVLTLERIVDLIRANEQDEFLSYFPEFKSMFNEVAAQLIEAQSTISQIVTDVTNWKSTHKDLMENSERTARKWFATDFKKKPQATLYFAEYDGRLNDMLTRMSTSKFISTFKIKIKEE